MGVLPDIETIALRPFSGNRTGIPDAIPVERLCSAPGGFRRGTILGSEVSADHPDWNALQKPFLARDVGKLADIIDEANDHRGAEISHQLDLRGRARFDTRALG